MSTHWQSTVFICHLFLFSTITSIPSYYYVQCDDNETDALSAYRTWNTIDDTTSTSPITLSQVVIPINRGNLTCLFRLYLSNNYTFEEDSKCTINFDITETDTLSPTLAPQTLDPTVEPTPQPSTSPTAPSISPSNQPSISPTVPTATVSPSQSPTTYSPTEIPTSVPSYNPTVEPTFQPTTDPTEHSPLIDLDEVILINIFNINDKNIFWQASYDEVGKTYDVQIAPSCINSSEATTSNTTFADQEVLVKEDEGIGPLTALINNLPNVYDLSKQLIENNPPKNGEVALFPINFYITSWDSDTSASLTYSQRNNEFKCYYEDAFETIEAVNDSSIDYYLFIEEKDPMQTEKRINVIIDIIITKTCISDPTPAPTKSPTTIPTMGPSIDFGAFTSTMTKDEDDDEDDFLGLGVSLEVFIAIVVAAGVLICASALVFLCLCKRKSIWEDDDEAAIIDLKAPKTVKETEMITNKFMVSEEDHAEMIELQKRNSLSTGLQI